VVTLLVKIVFWGDSHIPYRASRLPNSFIEFLRKEQPDIMIVTGDLVKYEVLMSVENFARRVYAVRGNMDEGKAMKLPVVVDFEINGIKLTIFHGHGVFPRGDPDQLYQIAKKRSAKIMITGHTHYPTILEFKDIFILNPGSVCGVLGGAGGYGLPTWGYMVAEENKIHVVIYEFEGNVVRTYEQRILQL